MDYLYPGDLDRRLPAIKNDEVLQLREQVLQTLDSDMAFTTFTEGETDESMNEQRAEQIINDLSKGDFRLQLTVIKHDGRSWVIEKSRNPVRASNRKDLFIFNRRPAL